MRGKKSKFLRKLAEAHTIGMPRVTYNEGSAILKPAKEPDKYFYTRRVLTRCQRGFYVQLKKKFGRGIPVNYEITHDDNAGGTDSLTQQLQGSSV